MEKTVKEKTALIRPKPNQNINNTQPNSKQGLTAKLKHIILLLLIAITAVVEVVAMIMWITNIAAGPEPNARFSLAVDYRIAVIDVAVFAALNSLAFFWIARRNRIGAPFLIGISILNRAISQFLFIGGAHGIFITWTAILVIFAYSEYGGLSILQTIFLALGAVVDLALSAVLFSAGSSATLGLAFYLAVLAVLATIVVAIRKLR